MGIIKNLFLKIILLITVGCQGIPLKNAILPDDIISLKSKISNIESKVDNLTNEKNIEASKINELINKLSSLDKNISEDLLSVPTKPNSIQMEKLIDDKRIVLFWSVIKNADFYRLYKNDSIYRDNLLDNFIILDLNNIEKNSTFKVSALNQKGESTLSISFIYEPIQLN